MSRDPVTSDLSESPTATKGTATGVILGTAPYMSPEQARGKIVDKRTDIWAFGCCLYETLTGRVAFLAETVSDTIAKVLTREPDWQMLPDSTPPGVLVVLRRCLQKDANQRLHDIADARIELAEAIAQPLIVPPATVPSHKPRGRATLWGLLGLGVLALGIGIGGFWRPSPPLKGPPRPLKRFVIPLPSLSAFGPPRFGLVALSPDGSHLVYMAKDGAGKQRLYLRPLDETEASSIPGTEDANNPFFSPDGQWIGFTAGKQLKKVPTRGGAPSVICDCDSAELGASWGPDGTIVFRPGRRRLMRVSALGGAPQEIKALPDPRGLWSWGSGPEILPNGKAALFNAGMDSVGVISLETGEWRTLLEGGHGARYAPSGHLVFTHDGSLLAVPFDLDRLEVKGSPVPVLDGVRMHSESKQVQFSLSSDGSLVYLSGGAPIAADRALVWVDRNGNAESLTETRRAYWLPRLSPDGRRLVVSVREGRRTGDVWIHDLSNDTQSRLTFGGDNRDAIWTPDGERVTFRSKRTGSWEIFWKPADGSGEAEQLTGGGLTPVSWSPDSRVLVVNQSTPAGDVNLLALRMKEGRELQPLISTPSYEGDASFSPDGRWLAYVSDETGSMEIYVQAFPGLGAKRQISNENGESLVWVASGRELIYQTGNELMSVAVSMEPQFVASTPRLLFEGPYELDMSGWRNFDVTADGQRFVMIQSEEEAAPTQINVILNWLDELERLVPTH